MVIGGGGGCGDATSWKAVGPISVCASQVCKSESVGVCKCLGARARELVVFQQER